MPHNNFLSVKTDKYFLTFIAFLLFCATGFAQVTGKVTDEQGNPLSTVNVYLENSYLGTTTNTNGDYSLSLKSTGTKTIVFQYLGYKTVKKTIRLTDSPYELNISLSEETKSLEAVVVNAGENLANGIIRKAIDHRKENLAKIKAYTADFYSRGTWTVENAPDKILGQKVDYSDMNLALDSTNSGILYLSETTSKIAYKAPNHFYEHILASKVSGNDNGFSWNTASDAKYSFYNNTLEINANLVSPIADFAFNYYTYKLVSAFYDGKGHLINKIKVIPKRPNDRSFSGFIYIVENSWQIYGAELKTTGVAAQIPPMKTLSFSQSFKYSKKDKLWVKISQTIHFKWKIFGISGTGQFIAVYSNYDFSPHFTADTFGNEVVSFSDNANKKDSIFWQKARPIPLTTAEATDYVKRDSIQTVHESKAYTDSIDKVHNEFSMGALLFGYHYSNSFKNYDLDFSSPLAGTHFNTVQGWNINEKVSFHKSNKDEHTYWRLYSDLSYGFADDRFRASGGFVKKFNNFSKPILRIEGGVKAAEINDTDPIPMVINDVATIFFERNYLKLYDKQYVEASYSEEWFNGFRFYSSLSYQRRVPLLNATDHVIRNDDNGGYTSNNPLAPNDFNSFPFKTNTIVKLKVGARINFSQNYFSRPNGKYNVPDSKYPTLFVGYEQGLASSISAYNYGQIQLQINQDIDLKNLGEFDYSLKGGKFFHGDDMAFVDYKHFNGNQTRVAAMGTYIGKFNLLPYYTLSTNDQYAELHVEQNFKGWLLGKIPGVNRLNFNVVLGVHALWTGGRKPYQEYSIGLDNLGWGSFRFFRVDYVESFYGSGHRLGAFVFGLKFLNVF